MVLNQRRMALLLSVFLAILTYSQVRSDDAYPQIKPPPSKLIVGGGGSKAILGGGIPIKLGGGGGGVVKMGGGRNVKNVAPVGGHGYFPSKDEVLYGGHGGYGPKRKLYKQVAHVGPIRQLCPFGWDVYNGNCYYFSRDKLSWYDASMKCAYMGGSLAIVNEAHENSYLKLMCDKNKMSVGAWFGLNDILFAKTHTWYWGYGKKQCSWFDWFGKGPKFKGPHHHCVCYNEGYRYQWGVENCRKKLYYICELNPKRPCRCGY